MGSELDSAAPPNPPDPSWTTRVFFNDPTAPRLRGVRAGWRFALYVILVGVFASVVAGAMRLLGFRLAGLSGILPPHVMYLIEGSSLVSILLASLIMAGLERRSWDEYGLPVHRTFRANYWKGIPWGIGALAVLLLLMKAAGAFSFGGIVLHGPAILKYGLLWLGAFTLVGIFEEFMLRGYALFTLASGMGFWPAAVLLSVLFGAMHGGNHGEDVVGLFSAGLIGLFFCLTLRRTGDLWFAVGMHAGWDWGESFLFGTPDSGMVVQGRFAAPISHGSKWLSGGGVGPEGSLLVFVVVGLLFLVFHLVYPARQPESLPSSGDGENISIY